MDNISAWLPKKAQHLCLQSKALMVFNYTCATGGAVISKISRKCLHNIQHIVSDSPVAPPDNDLMDDDFVVVEPSTLSGSNG